MNEEKRKQVIQTYLRKTFGVHYATKMNKRFPVVQEELSAELWEGLVGQAFEQEMEKDNMKAAIVKLEAMSDEELMSYILSSGERNSE